jgi:hypothetical protein
MHGVRAYWDHLLGPEGVHLLEPAFQRLGGVQHLFGHCAPKGPCAFIFLGVTERWRVSNYLLRAPPPGRQYAMVWFERCAGPETRGARSAAPQCDPPERCPRPRHESHRRRKRNKDDVDDNEDFNFPEK